MEGISTTGSVSILVSANRQPELALQLLQKSLATPASAPNLQSPTPVPAPASSTDTTTGRIIDIRV
ncbi:MAG: hypothetical protein ABIJ50_09475 [Pseudomonadota bacterium]